MKPISRIQCLGFSFWWCIYIRFKCIWSDIHYGSLTLSLFLSLFCPRPFDPFIFFINRNLIWFSAVEIFAFLFSHLMSPFGDDEMMKNFTFFSSSSLFPAPCSFLHTQSLSRIMFIVEWIHWNNLSLSLFEITHKHTPRTHSDWHWW